MYPSEFFFSPYHWWVYYFVFLKNFLFCIGVYPIKHFPCSSVSKESTCNAGDLGSIPGSGRSPGDEMIFVSRGWNGYPLQCSCLENPMDRGAWQVTVYGVTRVGHNWVTKHTAYPINNAVIVSEEQWRDSDMHIKT